VQNKSKYIVMERRTKVLSKINIYTKKAVELCNPEDIAKESIVSTCEGLPIKKVIKMAEILRNARAMKGCAVLSGIRFVCAKEEYEEYEKYFKKKGQNYGKQFASFTLRRKIDIGHGVLLYPEFYSC
jgi:hypothetical protein